MKKNSQVATQNSLEYKFNCVPENTNYKLMRGSCYKEFFNWKTVSVILCVEENW